VRRREFIGLLGGGVVWPLVAHAQQPATKMPRIGVIDNLAIWDHFRAGLRDLGYIEGRNITIEYRSAEGHPDRLAAVARELAHFPVDVIVAYGTAATHAAKQATTTIPIVMIGSGDLVKAGLVGSLARPGGNITGNTNLSPEMGAKRIQLIKEIVPTIARMAFLWNPNNASHAAYVEEWNVAPALGVKMILVEVRSSTELDSAFAAMLREQPDAFTMTADPVHQLNIDWVIEYLARNHVPAIYQMRENVVAGGLMSYGASIPDLTRRAVGYVQKILQSTKPLELPIEVPTKFDLTINLKTAKALGLTMPEPFLLRCDEVIE
jgi:putative tryptophan/tyrosine transport system substrate-binding protein